MAWIRRGKGSHYVVKRLRESSSRLTSPKLAKMRREATRLLGTDYDPLFEWSDNRLYCSEYVWKIYKRAADIEIGRPQPWSALALDSAAVQRLAKARLGHLPDPNARVITPVRMLNSHQLLEIARGQQVSLPALAVPIPAPQEHSP